VVGLEGVFALVGETVTMALEPYLVGVAWEKC